MYHKIALLFVMMGALCIPQFSPAAGWELYDDFSTGTLDLQKWNNGSTVSTITVENKRVKIIHYAGHPNKSGYLSITQDPGNILGIKAKITIASCTGDVRTRITGYAGQAEGYNIWSALQFQPGSDRIYSYCGLEGPPPDYATISELHYGQFTRPLKFIGKAYNSSMLFSNSGISYEVEGLGKIIYTYETAVTAATDLFKGIGTRSTNGEGPCTVYVDDVYILRP